MQTAEVLATLDVLASLAELADRRNYCRPNADRRADAGKSRKAGIPFSIRPCRRGPSCPTT